MVRNRDILFMERLRIHAKTVESVELESLQERFLIYVKVFLPGLWLRVSSD